MSALKAINRGMGKISKFDIRKKEFYYLDQVKKSRLNRKRPKNRRLTQFLIQYLVWTIEWNYETKFYARLKQNIDNIHSKSYFSHNFIVPIK